MNPDTKVYGVALLLTLASGFLFGAVPVRQVFRTDPYEIVKSGSTARVGRRLSVREALLAVQIAICAVLITSSMVALRGLMRSLHGNFGIEPRNAMLVNTDLNMAGYSVDQIPEMQKRMLDALQAIPGVESVGLGDGLPVGEGGGVSTVFTGSTTDLRSSNAAAEAVMFKVSPQYFQAAGTSVLAGRTFTWNDDKDAPRVAVVNREFASKVFGSPTNAVGGNYKLPDGTRIQVVGLVEDGKYSSLTENQRPAMFLPILQSPSGSVTWMVVRSSRDPEQLAAAIRGKLRELDAGLDFDVQTWNQDLEGVRFPARIATATLGVMGGIGAILAITGIFGMAAYSVSKRLRELGIRIALGAQRRGLLQAALGRALKLLAVGSAAGLLLGILASSVLAHIVYQATPRDPLVLAAVVVAMALLGLLATWIPAQRALSVDPLILLREE
jgi:predicted permease